MKLQFNRNFLSFANVDSMPDVSLPHFVVLTGLNGSGKTHLLKAIKDGSFRCDEIDRASVSYTSFEDLLSQQIEAQNIQIECEKFLESKANAQETWQSKIRAIYLEYLTYSNSQDHHYIVEELGDDTLLWGITQETVSTSLWEKICTFKKELGHVDKLRSHRRTAAM